VIKNGYRGKRTIDGSKNINIYKSISISIHIFAAIIVLTKRLKRDNRFICVMGVAIIRLFSSITDFVSKITVLITTGFKLDSIILVTEISQH